jgi:hypothetical protein
MYFSNQSNISGNSVPHSLVAADNLSSRLIGKLTRSLASFHPRKSIFIFDFVPSSGDTLIFYFWGGV